MKGSYEQLLINTELLTINAFLTKKTLGLIEKALYLQP